jgi:CheY-like chemotaxis protein
MNTVHKYILVDDDPFNNIISRLEIENAVGEADIKIFQVPEEALAFIQNEYIKSLTPAILFLDINMPTLSGWEFMEQYEKFPEEVKQQLSIYILSSSIDLRDENKAKANKYIKGFLSKPLHGDAILSIAGA